MATALRTQPKPMPRKQAARSRSHLQAVPSAHPAQPRRTAPTSPNLPQPKRHGRSATAPGVRALPTRRPMPIWLRLLIQLQRGSVVVAFVLVTAALVVYGSTIYMQQHWSKEYRKLKGLERSERQMIAAEGLIKNQLIQQAEKPGSGLVPRTTEHTLVLEPAPERVPVTANPVLNVEPPANSAPLGY